MIIPLLLSVSLAGEPQLAIEQCKAPFSDIQAKSDTSLYINHKDATRAVEGGEGYFIESRNTLETASSNAIKLQLHQLKTKHFLKTKPLYLLHDSKSLQALEREVIELHLLGFDKLYIVEESAKQREDTFNLIQPDKVVLNHQFANWLLISLDSLYPKQLNGLELNVSDQNARQDFYQVVSSYLDSHSRGKVIVAAADIQLYNLVVNWDLPINTEKLFFVEGGLNPVYQYAKLSDTIMFNKPTISENCAWTD